jgi:transcriptional regulator with XRE-family HTH domain
MPGFSRSRLRAVREASGMTRRQLGAAAGVHQLAIRQWETGHRVPTVETVGLLARALHVSPLAFTDRAGVKSDDLTLRDLRLLAGLTQQQAAAAAGLLRTTYSCLERGETARLSTEDAACLARGLEVSPLEVQAAQAASRASYLSRQTEPPSATSGRTDSAGPRAIRHPSHPLGSTPRPRPTTSASADPVVADSGGQGEVGR